MSDTKGMRIRSVGIVKIGNDVVLQIQDMDGKYHELGKEDVDGNFGSWWNLPGGLKYDAVEDFRLSL